ncbi:MAG: hypothetical protein AAFS10_05905 [Myxococcota bacterium]
MSTIEIETQLKDLKIHKGARHCRIVNAEGEVIFRTTNLRDAETYVSLLEENRRLHRLIEARGVAPHRIYQLDGTDPTDEIVIVAKGSADSVVVRHLSDGREELVDLDDVMPLEDVDYFVSSEAPVELVHVTLRFDRDAEAALIKVHRTQDASRNAELFWRRASYEREKEDEVAPVWSDKDCLVFRDEVVVED